MREKEIQGMKNPFGKTTVGIAFDPSDGTPVRQGGRKVPLLTTQLTKDQRKSAGISTKGQKRGKAPKDKFWR